MVSPETVQASSKCIEPNSSPRISFSADFLDENNFISTCPNPLAEKKERERAFNAEFEFLSANLTSQNMITADELFCEGKLLPFWEMHHSEKLNKISLKTENAKEVTDGKETNNKEEDRISWFLDDDPSPRPPKCTVLWKELLKLKKQHSSTLSLSSSSSSSSPSSSSSRGSLVDMPPVGKSKERVRPQDKTMQRMKKGLERTRSASMHIRPMINVPICTQGKNSALPPLYSIRKGRLER